MVDGSPRRRKDIKFSGSATNMEMNNMDGTGRGMADMTMTVPDTAMTNTGTKNNMQNNGMDMENMAMAVPNTAMTNTGTKNNMQNTRTSIRKGITRNTTEQQTE